MNLLAVDPGSVHCGLAFFVGGVCADAVTVDPPTLFAVVRAAMPALIVCESFRLRADVARSLAGDPLATVEAIGVLRYLADTAGVPFVLQSPTIKRPTRAMVRRRGIELIGDTEHARDAELHGWHWLLCGAPTRRND